MAGDYIRREDALFSLRKAERGGSMTALTRLERAYAEIREMPAADVTEVVHGQWVHSRYDNCSEQFDIVKCSRCGHEAYAAAYFVRGGNYCPNCGAKMDGGNDNVSD